MPVITATQGWRLEEHEFQVSRGKVRETLSQKQKTNKRTGGVAQVAEHMIEVLF
jgi:hypothetical protein